MGWFSYWWTRLFVWLLCLTVVITFVIQKEWRAAASVAAWMLIGFLNGMSLERDKQYRGDQ